jgi:hypothetical protein
MNPKEQSALILDLAVQLRNHGSWAGETHVQKGAYLLQNLLGVPSGFEFVLYKHGPFSFDLRESLSQMEAERFIELREQPYPYGPTIVEGKAASRLRASTDVAQRYGQPLAFLAGQLGSAKVADLERIATALYVTLDHGISPSERVGRLVALKPHIPVVEATAAFGRLEEIRAAALHAGLQPQIGTITLTERFSANAQSRQ